MQRVFSVPLGLYNFDKYGKYKNAGVSDEYYEYFLAMKLMSNGLLTLKKYIYKYNKNVHL